MGKLYVPPKGYYDLPFTWAYDGSGLTDGSNALNQFVYLQGGYGDFVLRRIAGLDRVLQPYDSTLADGGTYQIRDRYKNALQSAPVYAAGAPFGFGSQAETPDLGFPNEVFFPETGQLSFDLYNVLRNANPATAQVAFQGVRRVKGSSIRRPGFRARPKTFTYVNPVVLTAGVGAQPVYLRQQIDDYDFELYNIELVAGTFATVTYPGIEATSVTFSRLPGGTGDVTVQIVVAGINTPFSFVVTSNSITVNAQTDGTGSSVNGGGTQLVNAFAASPAAQALVSITVDNPLLSLPAGGPTVLGPDPSYSPITTPVSKMWIFDPNRVTLSSEPILDIYYDGCPGGVYEDGALCPPVYYPKESLIQIAFYSVLDPFVKPVQIVCHLVGRQYYPC